MLLKGPKYDCSTVETLAKIGFRVQRYAFSKSGMVEGARQVTI